MVVPNIGVLCQVKSGAGIYIRQNVGAKKVKNEVATQAMGIEAGVFVNISA